MINLLPPNEKKQLAAGRANWYLVRYLVLLIVFAVILLLIVGAVYIYLDRTKQAYLDTTEQQQAQTVHMQQSQAEVAEFRQNLAIAKQILDEKVDYTVPVLRIAAIIPSGVVLEQLTLDSIALGSPAQISARAKTPNDALRLKAAFNDSPYFSVPHFNTLARNDDSDYDYTVNMTVTLEAELTNE